MTLGQNLGETRNLIRLLNMLCRSGTFVLLLDFSHRFAKVDLSIAFIGRVESPRTPAKWNLDHLNKLAEILNCSPREFLPDHIIKEHVRKKA